ncbi:XRE family transcriptional regulator [Streptococcus oralis]|uniref:XRE family transcriptional regulator n=1 Tax=Streptococcus oralis TaxID=1303 RepID=A0A4Q2FQI0_STROR|nr:XRE family transcriptional regulator [Streptococcus oralis]
MWEQLNRIMLERNLNGNQLSNKVGVNRSFCLPNRKIKRFSEPFYPEP